MQFLRRCLGIAIVGAFIGVFGAVTGPQASADPVPSERTIERLLQQVFADRGEPFRLALYEGADLLETELMDLERGAGSTWHAVVALTIDYGVPSQRIVGFEQVRSGRYDVVLERVGERFMLKRVTQVGRVRLLPTGGA